MSIATVNTSVSTVIAGESPSGGDRFRSTGRKVLGSLVSAGITLVIILAAWRFFLWVFDVDSFIGRTPSTVWHSLVDAPTAGAARSALFHASGITLRDAFLGLFAGTFAGLVGAILFTLKRPVEQALMPMAMVLQSVPLVVMTPLIALIFGRGLLTVMLISGIVTFFPTLVNVSLAMRNVVAQSMDLMRAYGATPLTTLTKVQLPAALPAWFASLRIAAPLALIGGLLAEWLTTGQGLGDLMIKSTVVFESDQLWAAAALITGFSVILYGIISAIETAALARFGPDSAS